MSIEIVPAIDLLGGECVRLEKGDYSKVTNYGDPLDRARSFEDAGAKLLHLVDLTGARAGLVVHWDTIEDILDQTNLRIDFGGGVRSHQEVHRLLSMGIDMVTAGSLAVEDPDMVKFWIDHLGEKKVSLGADQKDGKIAISGWENKIDKSVFDFVDEWVKNGVRRVISTDIDRDGTMEGPSLDLYRTLREKFPELIITASGGVTKVSDIKALKKLGVQKAIVGRAIYEDPALLEKMIEAS